MLLPFHSTFSEAGCDAVSYTHLRAHETVLDLVCRLLLEKKNTKIISNRLFNTKTDINTHVHIQRRQE